MSDNKKKAILSSAVLLFVLSLVNKGLGFIKSMTIASVFGATIQTDAYYVAEGLMQNALIPISEAVAVSFLPIYITIKEKNKEEAHKFTSRTITDIFLLALVLSGTQYLFLQIRSRDYGQLTVRYGWRDSRIWKLCLQAAPIFFGNAICELNQLVDKSLLSGMETGSVTAVSYASVLYQFASNLISIPMTTIIYTELAESFAAGKKEEGGAKLEKGIHISLFFCIPLSLFVMIAANLVVEITYGRGAFDAQAVAMTSEGLRYYGLCFLAYCLNALLFRACYSLNDTMLPMKVGLGTVSLNIVLSIILAHFMGLKGVVLATAIANTLTCLVTLYIFNRTKLTIHLRRFIRPVLTIGVSSIVGLGACMLWMKSGIIANSILLFITSAMIHFGVYVVLVVIFRDEMALEVIQMGTELLRRKS